MHDHLDMLSGETGWSSKRPLFGAPIHPVSALDMLFCREMKKIKPRRDPKLDAVETWTQNDIEKHTHVYSRSSNLCGSYYKALASPACTIELRT